MNRTVMEMIRIGNNNPELIDAFADIIKYKSSVLNGLTEIDIVCLRQFFPFQTNSDGILSETSAKFQIKMFLERNPLLRSKNKDTICAKLKYYFTMYPIEIQNTNQIPEWAMLEFSNQEVQQVE